MTDKEYIARIEKQLQETESAFADALKIAVIATHTDVVRRVFDKGQTTDNSKIGDYNDTDPLYVNPVTSSPKKFPPKGKTGKTTFKNGKKHKTGYFESYKDFKGKIGRETSFVNLQLFGTLRRDFANSVQQIGTLAWADGFSGEQNVLKAEGIEAKYKKQIFVTSLEEAETFAIIFNDEMNKRYVK